MRKWGLLLLGFLAIPSLESQEMTGPDLDLPGMIFRIDSLPPEDLEPVFPPREMPEFYLPPMDAALVSEPVPTEELMGEVDPSMGMVAPASEESSVFARGTLGLGSMQGILGELSVAKTGGDLRFQAAFFHHGVDGYGFHAPGTGFFRREDQVAAQVDLDAGGGTIVIGASYDETEEGLQGRVPEYYSAVTRLVTAQTVLNLQPRERVELQIGGRGSFGGKTLTSPPVASPSEIRREEAEYTAGMDAALDYSGSSYKLGLSAGYGFRFSPDEGELDQHRLTTSLRGFYTLREGWDLDAGLGLFWGGGNPILPFWLGLSVQPGELLSLGLRGGFRVDEQNYLDLWKELGLLQLQGDLEEGSSWFGELSFQGKTRDDRARFLGTLQFLLREKALILGDFDSTLASIPFFIEERLSWIIGVEVQYRLFSRLTAFVTGQSLLGDQAFLERAQYWEPGLRFQGFREKVFFSLSALVDSADGLAMPDLRFQGGIRPAEGLEFSLTAEDILAFTVDEKRSRIPPFIDPGFRVMVKTRVSF